uniref:Uncharacterized protein n=1 Tax=Romanomermis culicivorax TaxID=13658 RepID=A0A915JLY5_ROMCU
MDFQENSLECCKEHALCYKSCKSRCVDLYFLQSYTVICDEVQGTAYITESSPCPNCAFNCDLTASLCFKENFSTFNKSAAVCYSNPVRGLLQSFNGQPVVNKLETWGDSFLNGAQSFFSIFGKK